MSGAWKAALGAGAVLVAVNATLALVKDLTGGTPGGPRSSSYATASDGVAAYAALLRRNGYRVERLRTEPSDDALDPEATAVLLDPPFVLREDVDALRDFVRSGGRLVAGGPDRTGWLGRILGGELEWTNEPVSDPRLVAPAPEVAGVDDVAGTLRGSWEETGRALPVLGDDDLALLAVGSVGRGRVAALADVSPLWNDHLARADNAQLGLALAGPRTRPLVFLESYHGYGESTGIDAVPHSWFAALALGLVAAAALMVAKGRRFGPPEAEARELPPPRRLYVDSLAAVVARTRRPAEAVEPVRERAARLLAADATRLGLSADELAAVKDLPRDAAGVVAAGRALARLERGRRWRG